MNKSLEYEIRDHGDNYFSPNICQGHLLCMVMILEKENLETKLEELDCTKRDFLCSHFVVPSSNIKISFEVLSANDFLSAGDSFTCWSSF